MKYKLRLAPEIVVMMDQLIPYHTQMAQQAMDYEQYVAYLVMRDLEYIKRKETEKQHGNGKPTPKHHGEAGTDEQQGKILLHG